IIHREADDREKLEHKHQRHRKHPEQRKSKSFPQSKIENDHAPANEYEDLGSVRDRASSVQFSTLTQKETLKDETGSREPEIQPHLSLPATTQRYHREHEAYEKDQG
ncbi:MAG: hypothetical protein L7V87_12505, partial [Verrucomicrobiales bacterium]|nr:hypothetical protein [Verrucomicrobiales bacterium]